MSNITLGLDKKGRCSRTNDDEGEENEGQGTAAEQQSRAWQVLGALAAAVAMGIAGAKERREQLLPTGNLAALCLPQPKERRPSAPFQMAIASRRVL